MSSPAFKTVVMQIPEEIAGDVLRQVSNFVQKRKAELSAELEAIKDAEKAMKAGAGKSGAKTGNAEPGKRTSKEEAKKLILADLGELKDAGSLIYETSTKLGISYGTIHRAIVELATEGKIKKGDDNRYRIITSEEW